MEKDTGSWLSAQQAILPDGTERGNLPLVSKKLPPLRPTEAMPACAGAAARADRGCALAAIKFAVGTGRGLAFLADWLQGDPDLIRRQWPDAPESVYGAITRE